MTNAHYMHMLRYCGQLERWTNRKQNTA